MKPEVLSPHKRKNFFFPPIFTGEEQSRTAYLLYIILWTILLAVSLNEILDMIFLPENTLRWLLLILVTDIFALALMYLSWRGHTRKASVALVICMLIIVTGLALTAGGIRAPAFITSLSIVFIAGLLLGIRAGMITAVTCCLIGLGLVWTDAMGIQPVSQVRQTPLSLWSNIVLNMIVITSLQYLSMHTIKDLLRQVRDELADRKVAEKALLESEERHKMVSRLTSDYTFKLTVKNDGQVVMDMASDSFFTVTGRTLEETRTPDLWVKVIHPDDIGRLMTLMDQLVARGGTVEFEGRSYTKGEQLRWIHIIAQALQDVKQQRTTSIIGAVKDITERKRAEERIRIMSFHNEALLASVPNIIMEVDNNKIYTWANKAGVEFFGADVLGKEVANYFEGAQKMYETIAPVFQGDENIFYVESWQRRRDGEKRLLAWWCTVLKDAKGNVTGALFTAHDITAQKQAEEALRESERKYQTIVDNLTDALYIIDFKGHILDVNEHACKMLGYTKEELIGANNSKMNSAEAVKYFLERTAYLLNHDSTLFESQHIKKDGSLVPVEISAKVVTRAGHGLIQAFVRDITERKRTEEKLQMLVSVVRHSSELIFLFSMDGKIIFRNEAGARSVGVDAREMEQISIMQIIPEHLQAKVRTEALPTLLQSGTWEGELQYRNLETGALIDVYAMTFTITDPHTGVPLCLANVSLDITERKRAEQERMRMETKVQQTQKLESLGVLAGGIAHDFNNMLMVILGNADLALLDLSEVSPIRPMLLEINKVTHRAAELCKQMLAYSGKSRLVMKPVNLSELVEEMGHMLKISISKKATLLYNLSKDLWPIKADATQIRQIIMNLIINASEALNDKSGIISITTGWMECDRSYLMKKRLLDEIQEGNYVYLEVSDTGIGMSPAILDKIFDPFFTTKFTGRGLGLAAVLGIVHSHNGAIQVSSEPDKGTTFKVLFPALSLAGVTMDNDQPIKENWKGSGTLLLVDDEEAVRSLCRQMLQRLGFEVLVASDGRQALDIFREHRDKIRCTLLDLTMPHLDGEETFQELCRIDPNIRVIMSSGFNEQKAVNPSIEKRLVGFIQKPYQLSDLTAVLKKVLEG